MANQISIPVFNATGNKLVKQNMLATLTNISPTVTQEDITLGIKERYFARYKAQRDGTIYEIAGDAYASIENNSLFVKTRINWIIRGKIEDTLLTLQDGTTILVKGVISQNKALLSIANEQLPGIMEHLQNYIEFWSGE
jgi:hypothetical protein